MNFKHANACSKFCHIEESDFFAPPPSIANVETPHVHIFSMVMAMNANTYKVSGGLE